MTSPDDPDSAMASGSDAGEPGEHLGAGDLTAEERRVLEELERDAPAGRRDDDDIADDAVVRAAEDEGGGGHEQPHKPCHSRAS